MERHDHTRGLLAVPIGLAVLVAAACGGSGGKDVSSSPTTVAAAAPTSAPPVTTAPDSTATTAVTPSGELPAFSSAFSRVCTTQVGYSGATAYDMGPSVHPVAVFEHDDGQPSYFESVHTLPQGWTLPAGSSATDNTQLAAVQLIACIDRTATTSTSTNCQFDSDGNEVTLTLVNATYDVTVYAARTGQEVGAATVDATASECPYVAAYHEGDTQYITSLSDDDVTNALKPYVTPAG